MKSKLSLLGLILIGAVAHTETIKPDVSVSGFFDGYYSFNFNSPPPVTTGATLPPANNTYRYYDAYHNQFTVNLAELTVKAAMKEVSFVVDLDFGPFADLNAGGEESSKHIGQAVLSYRPADSRFSFDVGKMYSHLGVETVKSKDNFNYSRSILFSYAIPFWHTGIRVGYDVIPGKFQTSFYVYNGWNTQFDNNRSKTVGAQLKYTPTSETTLIYNFLGGPERSDSESDWRTIHEVNFAQTISSSFALICDLIYGIEENAPVGSSHIRAQWYGALMGLRYQLNERSYLSPRYEIYRDNEGYNLGGGVAQTINSVTLTYGRTVAQNIETRLEARSDFSSASTFASSSASGTSTSQTTLMVAALIGF